MNKSNDCLMIGSSVCGLNSELFLHTDKKQLFFLLEIVLLYVATRDCTSICSY